MNPTSATQSEQAFARRAVTDWHTENVARGLFACGGAPGQMRLVRCSFPLRS